MLEEKMSRFVNIAIIICICIPIIIFFISYLYHKDVLTRKRLEKAKSKAEAGRLQRKVEGEDPLLMSSSGSY